MPTDTHGRGRSRAPGPAPVVGGGPAHRDPAGPGPGDGARVHGDGGGASQRAASGLRAARHGGSGPGHRPAGPRHGRDVHAARPRRRRPEPAVRADVAHLGPVCARGRPGRWTCCVGKAIPLTALFTVQQAVLFVFADAVYGFDIAAGSWRLPLLVVSWSVCVTGIGLAVGAWMRTQGQLSAAADVGALAVTCLSGSLVPARDPAALGRGRGALDAGLLGAARIPVRGRGRSRRRSPGRWPW